MKDDDKTKGSFCAHCGGMVGEDGYALELAESEEEQETPETTQMESTETMRHFADAVAKRRELMSSYNPGRPPSEKDILQTINGSPLFLGALVSGATTTPVNNATTATPFNTPNTVTGQIGRNKPSLAGRVLLLQPIATGLMLPSTDVSLSIVQQATVPSFVAPFAYPGILVTAGERVVWTMPSDAPYLQWLSTSGSATCLVWEMA